MQEYQSTWPRRISIVSAIVVICICSLVLVGWITHNLNFITIVPDYSPMTPASGVCFLLIALALTTRLVNFRKRKSRSILRILGTVLISFASVIAAIHLAESFTSVNIDEILFPSYVRALSIPEIGHMSLLASFLVFCLAIGFVLQTARPHVSSRGQVFLILAGACGLMGVVAHMYGPSGFFLANGVGISIPSSVCSLYLAIGILALRTDIGVTTFFVKQEGGSLLVRQLLWAALVVPLVLSLVISWAENLKLLEPSLGSSLFTVSIVGAFFVFISFVAKKINEAESEKINLVREQTARMQAEEAVRERDEFLSICSHELKTPLTSMQLQFQWAHLKIQNGDNRILEPESFKKLVANTNRQIKRLGRLIEDMLDVSRVTSGKLSLNIKRINLTALIQEVLEDLKNQLDEAKTIIEVVSDSDVVVPCDRHWIGQVATNLLTNAGLKYGAGRPVKIIIRKEAERAVLSVQDNGIGIAPEDFARIFKRFERGISAENFSGLGLGLYISRQIIDGHAGTIEVKSEHGKGSLFTVTLPLQSRLF